MNLAERRCLRLVPLVHPNDRPKLISGFEGVSMALGQDELLFQLHTRRMWRLQGSEWTLQRLIAMYKKLSDGLREVG